MGTETGVCFTERWIPTHLDLLLVDRMEVVAGKRGENIRGNYTGEGKKADQISYPF